MSHSESKKDLLFRPWEKTSATWNVGSRDILASSGRTGSTTTSTQFPAQIHATTPLKTQQCDVIVIKHLRLIQEFKKTPRDSLSGSLWISTLLHSYLARINTARIETEKLQIISQTRQLLHTYLQMTVKETEVKGHARNEGEVKLKNLRNEKKQKKSSELLTKDPVQSFTPMIGTSHTPKETCKPHMVGASPMTPVGSQRLLPPTTPDSGYKSPTSQTPISFNSATSIGFISPDAYASHLNNNSMQQQQHITSPASTQPLSTSILPHQSRTALQEWYLDNIDCPYPTDLVAEELAAHSGLTKTQVMKWLSNRRNKDGNTRKTAGRRKRCELNRAKPYTSKRLPQMHLQF